MLDVAAVAGTLIPTGPLRHLSAAQHGAIIFLIALQDLGKISASFKAQIVEKRSPDDIARHWRLSEFLLYYHDALIAALVGGSAEVREVFYVAVAGHHGRPPPQQFDQRVTQRQKMAIGLQALADSGTTITALAPVFGPMTLDGIDEATARRLGLSAGCAMALCAGAVRGRGD